MLFSSQNVPAWNGKQWLTPCTHAGECGRRSPDALCLLVSCSFVTGRYHSTWKWHKGRFCWHKGQVTQGQKSHTFVCFYFRGAFLSHFPQVFLPPREHSNELKKTPLSPFWSKENKHNVGSHSLNSYEHFSS